ncbi:hypothetical protein JHK86_011725 [Glycine max]|nr:hypothetical protein JHK86_011725 [Glycine max]
MVIGIREKFRLAPSANWNNLPDCATLVQDCGDSEIGRVVIQAAKERKYKTISIIDDKPVTLDIIEELKALGGDIVPESHTKTWYGRGPKAVDIV